MFYFSFFAGFRSFFIAWTLRSVVSTTNLVPLRIVDWFLHPLRKYPINAAQYIFGMPLKQPVVQTQEIQFLINHKVPQLSQVHVISSPKVRNKYLPFYSWSHGAWKPVVYLPQVPAKLKKCWVVFCIFGICWNPEILRKGFLLGGIAQKSRHFDGFDWCM